MMSLHRHRRWLVPLGFATAFGVFMTLYRYLGTVLDGGHPMLHAKLIEEMSAAYGVLLLFPGVAWWARRARRVTERWDARLLALALPLPIFCVARTAWMMSTR